MSQQLLDTQVQGQTQVIGVGQISIELEATPLSVVVAFVGEPNPIPCNVQPDSLSWHLDERVHHHKLTVSLVIEWHTTSARNIAWTVSYC